MCGLAQKQYVPLMLLTAYIASELLVNMLKDNIKMEIKGMALMTRWNESNLINV